MDLKVATLLFPLGHLETRLGGYYISKDGDVFSTMQTADGRRMYGSNGSVTLNRISYNKRALLLRAKAHVLWLQETSAVKPAQAKVLKGAVPNRNHASSLDEGLNGKGWVIAQVAVHDGVKHLLFGSKPAIHMTANSLKSEMERLATSKPGTKFVSLKVENSLVSGGLVWE